MITILPTDQIITEMTTAIDIIADPTEGLVDYQGTHLLDPVLHLELLKKQEGRYRHRHELYDGVIAAARTLIERIQAVLDDGYPNLPILEVESAVLVDFDDQIRTILAARKTFTAKPLLTTTVAMEVSDERPSPRK